MSRVRTFVLRRDADVSGVSGLGDVAAGVVFADGTTVLRWNRAGGSTAVYDSLERMEAIHGHDGRTSVVWLADTPSVEPPTEWHPAIASDVANHYRAQSEFYVQQAEAMGVLLFKIIRALGLPPDASPTTDDDPLLFGSWRASRVLASFATIPVSDDTEGAG